MNKNFDNPEYHNPIYERNGKGYRVRFHNRNSSVPVDVHNSTTSTHPSRQRPAARERKSIGANPCISPPEVAEYISVRELKRNSLVPIDRQSLHVRNNHTMQGPSTDDVEKQETSKTFWNKYTNFAQRIISINWLLIPVLFILLGGSICLVYMGTVHRKNCRFFPIIDQYHGGLGIAIIVAQFICMVILRLVKNHTYNKFYFFLKIFVWSSFVSFLIIYAIEVGIFVVRDFNHSPRQINFCTSYFYNFTKTYIVLKFIVLVSTAVINFPICYGSLQLAFDEASKIVIR